jgi:hypothetical protein
MVFQSDLLPMMMATGRLGIGFSLL